MDNQQLFSAIFSLHSKLSPLTPLMVITTKYSLYIAFLLGTLIAFKEGSKEKKAWVLMVAGLILIYPVIEIVRLFIQEPRPFTTFHFQPLINPPTDLSFPSGHSSFMSVIASAFFFARSRWFWFFTAFALLVGFSRIYVGVHYPLDVLGGFALGFILTFVLKLLMEKLYKKFLGV